MQKKGQGKICTQDNLSFKISDLEFSISQKYWMKKHFMNAGTVAKILRI